MEAKISYPYRISDIISGAITHGLGVLLALAGSVPLLAKTWHYCSLKLFIGISIFCLCLILSYLFSTLYHSLVRTKAYKVFRILDHSLIYLLIAGTYSPIVLVALNSFLGWSVFIIIWLMAISGIISKCVALGRHPKLSVVLYLLMGWMAIFFIVPLWHALPGGALALMFLGGACYTGGIVFFAHDRIPYFHAIWHIFVLAGSVFHYFMIYFYIAGNLPICLG